MGADCKSVGLRLRRFESCTCHQPPWSATTLLRCSRLEDGHRPQSVRSRLRGRVESVRNRVQTVGEQVAVSVERQHRRLVAQQAAAAP